MSKILLSMLVSWSVLICKGYDILEGLVQQGDPCFETIDSLECNISLSKSFTPTYEGTEINNYDTKMFLFTAKNPYKAEPLHKCGGKLMEDSDFDPQVNTVVIVHGYIDGVCRTAWMREIKVQLFKRANYNVILTDWTWGNTLDVAGSRLNSMTVGEQIGFVVKNIMIQKNLDGNKFHFVGHSLGAVAVSHAAKFIKRWNETKIIRRITGLDPAVFPNRNALPSKLFHYTDAEFVDVIHSNGINCFPHNVATDEVIGHANFFPNGGSTQASCVPYMFTSLLKMDYLYGVGSLIPPLCFHLQSIQFFKISINPPSNKYIGVRCDNYEEFESGVCKRCCNETGYDCAVAGMDAEFDFPHDNEPTVQRRYFFNTQNICPYDEDYEFSIYKDC